MIKSPKREDAIFAAATSRPTGQRASFLRDTCGGDTAMRTRLETRLAAATPATPVDDDQTVGTTMVSGTPLNRIPEEGPGDAIGRYTLIEVIGEGGCGLVYLAEQKEPVRRQVALKITKLGMDTKQVVARFEAERQALALMDHPHIASVIDGGATATGRPFFVMELVRGTRITQYCDDRNLSTRGRLKLFIQVCQAIEHAHEKGVIHRDIKPSNILVAEHERQGTCKVIDFGIAKATQGILTDKTVHTQVDQFLGTPAYMSPEQAGMGAQEPDARSDIYSLGVLLYELLTGSTPFEAKGLLARGFDEMRRIILEMEPVRPSNRLGKQDAEGQTNTARRHGSDAPKLINIVRGDLDWIVMKCLEKDRTRRYASASELTADLQRFLASQPILARPPSQFYRFRKLVQRNRLAFAVGGAFFGTMVAGLCVTTYYVIKEYDARLQAERAEAASESARYIAERSRDEAMLDREDAEAARAKAEAALRLSESNRLKAEASDKTARLSQQEEEANKAEAAAEEENLRRQAEVERAKAENAHAQAELIAASLRTESDQAQAAVSNILAGLDALPPEEALKAAAVFFTTEDAPPPAATLFLQHRGEWRARSGDATNALADFSKVLALEPRNREAFTAAAVLLAQSGDTNRFRRLCHDFLAQAARSNAPVMDENVGLSCLLLPGPDASLPSAVVSAGQKPGRDHAPWLLAVALADYRLNHFTAIPNLTTNPVPSAGAQASRNISASAILALAQQQLHRTNDAGATLAAGLQLFETSLPKPPGRDWRDWIIARILLQEASSAITPPSSSKTSTPGQ